MIVRGFYNDIHPSAKIADDVIISGWCYIGPNAEIGSGTKLANRVSIGSDCKVGKNCNFQEFVLMNSGILVEDNCFFAAYTKTADEVFPSVGEQIRRACYFKEGSVCGINSTIICATIGKMSVVGAQSLVLKDVPDGQVWKGSPATYLYDRDTYDQRKREWEKTYANRASPDRM